MDWNGSNGKTSEPIVTQSREKLKENKKKKKRCRSTKKIRKLEVQGPKNKKHWNEETVMKFGPIQLERNPNSN
jgi:hypothetical protein